MQNTDRSLIFILTHSSHEKFSYCTRPQSSDCLLFSHQIQLHSYLFGGHSRKTQETILVTRWVLGVDHRILVVSLVLRSFASFLMTVEYFLRLCARVRVHCESLHIFEKPYSGLDCFEHNNNNRHALRCASIKENSLRLYLR